MHFFLILITVATIATLLPFLASQDILIVKQKELF